MRSIKTLIKLLGAVSLTTITSSSVLACSKTKLNQDFASLLEWYDEKGNSKIEQILELDDSEEGKEKVTINAQENLIKMNKLFTDKLLKKDESNNDKENEYKSKDSDSTKFLSDLGFKSGSETKVYSSDDFDKISKLIAKVKKTNPGKIEENEEGIDFKIGDGNCTVDIMNDSTTDSKVLKSYTIKTNKNEKLGVPNLVKEIFTEKILTENNKSNYVIGKSVITSLNWKTKKSKELNIYNSFVKLFGKASLIWSSDAEGKEIIDKYSDTEDANAYLTIKFGKIAVLTNFDFGKLNKS